MDLVIAATALILLSPVILFISLVIRLSMGSPALFRQERPGLDGKIFTLYKFRTMSDAKDPGGNLLPDKDRLTGLGEFLRSFSLDELPQLFNVLTGDMSIVGPRPLLVEYLGRYLPHHARRHEIKPGLTGWAQIHGRREIKFSERLDMDVWYIDNFSLWLDIRIIIMTALKVIRREGYQELPEDGKLIDDVGLTDAYYQARQAEKEEQTVKPGGD